MKILSAMPAAQPEAEAIANPPKCEDTLCAKLDYYPKCSRRWFAALQA